MSKYKSKSAMMKHEKTEGKKERMMEYGKMGKTAKGKMKAKPKAKVKKK